MPEYIYAPTSGDKAYDYIHLTDGFNTWILPVTTDAERDIARRRIRDEGLAQATIWHGVPEHRHSKAGRSYPTRGELYAAPPLRDARDIEDDALLREERIDAARTNRWGW